MIGLMLGQSLVVTGVTVIVLHAKTSPIIMYCMESLVAVFMKTKRGTKILICDCTIHHGTQPVCKVSDLNYLRLLRYRELNSNNNNNNKQKK